MSREEMLKAAKNMRDDLAEKEVTPHEAETIAEFLLEIVQKNNEEGRRRYMMKGKFE